MFKSKDGLKIKTLEELRKASIHCSARGDIENGEKFTVEALAYYDVLDILGHSEGIERKFNAERQKARNMIKLYYADDMKAYIAEEKLITKTLELAMKKGLVA